MADKMIVTISSAFSSAETEPFWGTVASDTPAGAALEEAFSTSNHVDGWVTASRIAASSGLNYVTINQFQRDADTTDILAVPEISTLAQNYGNSDNPRQK